MRTLQGTTPLEAAAHVRKVAREYALQAMAEQSRAFQVGACVMSLVTSHSTSAGVCLAIGSIPTSLWIRTTRRPSSPS